MKLNLHFHRFFFKKEIDFYRLRDFSVTIPRCYEDVYVDNFVRKPGPGIFLPAECFPVIYDLNFIRSLVGFFYLTALLSQFFLATSYPSFPLF